MSNATLVKLAVAVVLLALGLLLASSFLYRKETKVVDENRCPICGTPYSIITGRVCVKCPPSTKAKAASAADQPPKSTAMRYVLIGLLTFLVCGVSYLLYREYRARSPVLEEEVLEFRCPACGRKLGVRLRQSGKRVMCPGCRQMLQLPQLD